MRRIYVVNELHEEIIIWGGTGSTFLPLKTIPPRKHGSVCVNSNATFREFVVILERSPERPQTKFNSDEIEWAEIRITGHAGLELTCVTSLRSSHGVGGGMMTFFSNSFQFILRKFGIGGMSDAPAPQDGQTSGGSPTGGSAQTNQVPQTNGAEDQATGPVI